MKGNTARYIDRKWKMKGIELVVGPRAELSTQSILKLIRRSYLTSDLEPSMIEEPRSVRYTSTLAYSVPCMTSQGCTVAY